MAGHRRTGTAVALAVAVAFLLSGVALKRSGSDSRLVQWMPVPTPMGLLAAGLLPGNDTQAPPSPAESTSAPAAPDPQAERGESLPEPSNTSAPAASIPLTPPPVAPRANASLLFAAGIGPELHTALLQYAAWFREESRGVHGAGALLALLNRTGLPPAMRSEIRPRVMIANVGANGWADNLKCAIDLFLLAVLDRRLFFINARTVPLPAIFTSPYFDWHHPDTAALIAALRQAPAQQPQFATRSLHPEMGRVNLTAYFP
eukprot:EG_transcript_22805